MMNAQFGIKESALTVDKAFNRSFGDAITLSEDSFGGVSKEYFNPWTGVNYADNVVKSFEASLQKSSIDTQTGGAGTAGTALIPVWVDNNIVDRTARQTPLRTMIPRRAIKGLTYDYVPLTAKGGAVFAFENAAIADQVDTFDRVSVPIKFAYAKGRISGPAIAAMRGFIDPSQLDLGIKTTSMFELAENAIINGDASTNPEEYNGLIKSITTNTTNLSGASPNLAQIRAEIATSFNNNGQIDLAVTDASTLNYIKGLLLDIQRNVEVPNAGAMGFGIPDSFMFDGVLFIKDRYMPTTSSSRRILFLDMRYVFMAVLQDMTYEEKASENDSWVYMLKEYSSLVVTHEAACTQMYGIL